MSQLDVSHYLKADDICGCDRKGGDTTGKCFSGFRMSLSMLRSSASQHRLVKKPLDLIHDGLNSSWT